MEDLKRFVSVAFNPVAVLFYGIEVYFLFFGGGASLLELLPEFVVNLARGHAEATNFEADALGFFCVALIGGVVVPVFQTKPAMKFVVIKLIPHWIRIGIWPYWAVPVTLIFWASIVFGGYVSTVDPGFCDGCVSSSKAGAMLFYGIGLPLAVSLSSAVSLYIIKSFIEKIHGR